jgi:hypothetical protein
MNSRLFVASDASINGLTLGKGGGDISYNTAFGYQALYSNTTGSLNTAIGYQALTSNTTGAYNTAIGLQGLFLNTTGGYNTSLGNQSLFYNTTGGQNTAVGRAALLQNTGSNNTALGANAGTAGTANTSGSNNTYVGYNAQANGSGYTQSTALGSGATITGSYQVVLGTTSETVRYNKLSPLYTSLPTFASTDIGYTASFSLASLAFGTGVRSTANTSIALPIGVYMCHLFYKIDISISTTTRTVIDFQISSGASLVNPAIMGFVYSPAMQEYNYYSIPAILQVSANPCSVFSILTANGGNCNITTASLGVVRIA